MTWQLRIPYRSRDDSLADVAEAARELPAGEDRAVARQLALGALLDGSAADAGELLDRVEAATPAQRRKMLDEARVKAGLPTIDEVAADARNRVPDSDLYHARVDRRPPRFALSPSGVPVDLNAAEDEAARTEAEQESRRRRLEAEQADRRADAAAKREADEARDRWWRSEQPLGPPR